MDNGSTIATAMPADWEDPLRYSLDADRGTHTRSGFLEAPLCPELTDLCWVGFEDHCE